MKISKSMIAVSVIALLPLASIAGEQDKIPAPMDANTARAQFNSLDTDRDGRISRSEAAGDSKIMFTEADKNGDGYLDSSEYVHRNASKDAMPDSGNPASDTETPRQ